MAPDRTRSSWITLSPDSPVQTLILLFLVAVLSYLTTMLGWALMIRPQMLWPVWPGCAFLVAVLLLLPRRIWPFLITAGLAGFLVYDLQVGLQGRQTIFLVLADIAEILIAALGVSYSFDGPPRLNSIESLLRYSFFSVMLAPAAAASISSVGFGQGYWIRWRIGFFTEALALLTLTPAILSWVNATKASAPKPRAFYFEATALVAGLSLVGYVAFAAPGHSGSPALLYSLLPFLLWSALRFGVPGISTSMIVVAFLSVWGAVHGRGPFAGSDPLNNVMSLQLFFFFAAATFMVLAVVVEERRQSERAYRESEKRFRLVADTAPVLIWMADTHKLCNYFNKPWLEFTGRTIASEFGNGWAQGVHPEDLQRCMDTYTHAFDRREEFRMEYRLRRHDGEYRWIIDIGVPRFDQQHSFIGYIGTAIDVTERKHAEEALRESEERFRLAAQAGQMFAYEWDVATDTVTRSEEYASVLGLTEQPKRLARQEVLTTVHADDREQFIGAVADLTAQNPTTRATYRMLRPDGTVIWVEKRARAFFDEQGKMFRMIGMIADITERKRAEEALSSMSRKLIDAQEQERARIARELHDDIGQRLSLLAVELDQLHQEPNFPAVRTRMAELQKQASEIATSIQTLSHELHSSKLEYLGIAGAMRSFCQEFGRQHKVEIDFKTHDLPSPLSPDISLCLFRVLQEALHNSLKHSGVRRVEIGLWGTLEEIYLTVSDLGAGFDSEAVRKGPGLGLVSMAERLKLVKGTLRIDSQPKQGTTIHARVPFSSKSDSLQATG